MVDEMAEPGEGKFRESRIGVAAIYITLPILITVVSLLYWRDVLYFAKSPCYTWRAAFCVLFGFWGVGLRAFHLREYNRPAWPEYFTVYPFIAALNGLAIFTVLSLFTEELGLLFFTAAVPLAAVLGFYCHPDIWLLSKLISNSGSKG